MVLIRRVVQVGAVDTTSRILDLGAKRRMKRE
jgi:hypothetical protein